MNRCTNRQTENTTNDQITTHKAEDIIIGTLI